MAFISTVPISEAQGEVRSLYERQSKPFGYLPNYAKVYSLRPQLMLKWAALQHCMLDTIHKRDYVIVSFAVAAAINTKYCALAFARKLEQLGFSAKQIQNLAFGNTDYLNNRDGAIAEYAIKVAKDSSSVTEADIKKLHAQGLSEEQIFDIAVAASARCFFAKTADAVGTLPDAPLSAVANELGLESLPGRNIDTEHTEKFE